MSSKRQAARMRKAKTRRAQWRVLEANKQAIEESVWFDANRASWRGEVPPGGRIFIPAAVDFGERRESS